MKKRLLFATLLDVFFLLFFVVASAAEPPISEIFYYLAFVFPIFLGLMYLGSSKGETRMLKTGIDSKSLALSLPLVFPTVSAVFLISALTSILLSAFGFFDTVPDLSGNIITVLFVNAVLPAVLEEFLFRYIPINLLADGSRKGAILFSAGMFALVHCNIFQFPYAFAAGVVFAAVDIGFGSVIPSLIIHLVNNTLSVFWLRFDGEGILPFVCGLSAVTILSLALIFVMRKKYKTFFAETFYGKR